MALAALTDVKERVIAILNANPGVWSSSVSGNVGAFPTDDEMDAAALEADEWVATRGYFQSVNSSLADGFETVSASLNKGDDIPFHHGDISRVELDITGAGGWTDEVIQVNTKDDINELSANSAYVGASSTNEYLYALDNGRIYHNADFARVTYHLYTRTAALQCNQNEETLIIAKAISLLAKHASPALFDYWRGLAEQGLQELVSDGVYTQQEID